TLLIGELPDADSDEDDEDGYGGGWFNSYERLSEELRRIVDAVAEDPDYDDRWRADVEVLSRHAAHLHAEDYEMVKQASRGRFHELHGRRLDTDAERIAARLVVSPEF